MKNAGVVAVQGVGTAGMMTWWRLSGEVDRNALLNAWVQAGLNADQVLAETGAAPAMLRAITSLETKRRMVRPLAGQKGWTLVEEYAVKDTVSYVQLLNCRLDSGKNLSVQMLPAGAQLPPIDALDGTLEGKLRIAFAHHKAHLSANDISAWLTKLVHAQQAVSLRDTGGIYFIPEGHCEAFRQMVEVLGSVSAHTVYEVPALKTEKAVKAILDAVLHEADVETAAMETEIDTGDLGARALQTRAGHCDEMVKKVEVYEALLGQSMEELRQRIENLKAQITVAALAADSKEEAA